MSLSWSTDRNRFKRSEVSKCKEIRRRVFPDLAIEGDSLMSIACGYVVLDMVKLDDELPQISGKAHDFSRGSMSPLPYTIVRANSDVKSTSI